MAFNTRKAIAKSYKNKDELTQSEHCGCYNCMKIFIPIEIVAYIDNGKTALCPYCDMDTVICASKECNITFDFLKSLKKEILEC